jgi:sigma-B regulation protein RsbU (phosphoserine phosphatase)
MFVLTALQTSSASSGNNIRRVIRLLTLGSNHATAEQSTPSAVLLFTSMAAFMILPRQFHVMVIENSDEKHILKAMWLFPLYMLLIALFAMPIALGGILISKSPANGDMFALSIPLASGQQSVAMLAFLGGLSAAGGMVIVESVSVSTMLFNHIFMPSSSGSVHSAGSAAIDQPETAGIFIVIISGYYYFHIVGHKYSLSEMA